MKRFKMSILQYITATVIVVMIGACKSTPTVTAWNEKHRPSCHQCAQALAEYQAGNTQAVPDSMKAKIKKFYSQCEEAQQAGVCAGIQTAESVNLADLTEEELGILLAIGN